MNEIIKTDIIKTKSNKNLLTMQIKRTHSGCKLFVKSDIFEDFFSKNGIYQDKLMTNSDSHEVYKNNSSISNREIYRKLNALDDSLINSDGYINASFLRVKGISQGVTFDLSGLYSKEALTSYINSIKIMTKELYEEFMKPQNQSIKISIEEG